MKSILLILYIVLIFGCARGPLTKKEQALRLTENEFNFSDDMNLEGFSEALKANIQHLKTKPQHQLHFGTKNVSSHQYLSSLEDLLMVIEQSPEKLSSYLKDHFQVYEVFGQKKWGEAFITSYYEPVLDGRHKKSEEFSQALYAVPKDMVIVRLDEFAEAFGSRFKRRFCKIKENCVSDKKMGILRARIKTTKGSLPEILPYFSRAEIDKESFSLEAEVLAWVRPLDAFVLQIQGSGTILFEDQKELKLGYAGQNGHSYQAIGKYLFHVIPKDKMSLQRIEAHVKSLSPKEQTALFNKNPSYIFFKEIETKPVTYFGIETMKGRTIATDKRYFPKGALGYLQFKKPVFQTESEIDPSGWQEASRFVFDHDTGGAIKGGGRLDLFWGKGHEAKRSAGVMKQMGRLYYLAPKKTEKIKLN